MTLTATYDATLARVRLTGSGLPDGYARLERSLNGVLWETVRGGTAVNITGGTWPVPIDDYEFADGVPNFYRLVPAVDQTWTVPAEDSTTGEAWSVPAGVRSLTMTAIGAGGSGQGDLPPASQRARGGGGGGAYASSLLQVTPGQVLWVRVGEGGRRDGSGAAGQSGQSSTVSWAGGLLVEAAGGGGTAGVGPGTGGQVSASTGQVRQAGGNGGARESVSGAGGGGGGSGTAVAAGTAGSPGAAGVGGVGGTGSGSGGAGGATDAPGVTGAHPGGGGGGQGDIQGSDTPPVPEPASGEGGHGQVGLHSWAGGAGLDPADASTQITPDLGGVCWLKSIRYPFLNRPFRPGAYGAVTRQFRGGVFPVQGRSMPVATTDVRAGRGWTQTFTTRTLEAARDMDLVIAANEVMFIQPPRVDTSGCGDVGAVPGGYVVIDATTTVTPRPGSRLRDWTLPVREVARPAPEIVGTTLTWAAVLGMYGSWQALLASTPTWVELYQQVADPADAVVW